MGICKDDSTNYLKRLGYNVIRHPQEGIHPLQLIGRQDGASSFLGSLNQLISNPPGPLPTIDEDLTAADINGQKSSKLQLAVGANILGSVIGAMGGSLGVNTTYTNARLLEFVFSDVLKDRATPLDVGNYLRAGDVDADNKILSEYVIGNGELFLILETVKTKKLTVNYERDSDVGAKVEIPVIQELVGGKVQVGVSGESSSTITYEGEKYLTFGFRCFEVGVEDGALRLMASTPGSVPLAASLESEEAKLAEEAALLSREGVGLVDLRMGAV